MLQIFLLFGFLAGLRGSLSYSTIHNPMLPGFFPDPSCIFVPEWDHTFFCASSSFSAFPGIPIHVSKDLQTWKLASNALSRTEQLPTLALTNKSTSGIWAPTIRFHDGVFYVLTTLVFDDQAITNASRWDNLIFTSKNPFLSSSWSNPVHFNFTGYDTSPHWDSDGTVYVSGAHPWQVRPGIDQTTLNLQTGQVGEKLDNVWNGTGGLAPEGPHIYRKDGYYYLMIAEGGTGLNHMETIARSKHITGPYEASPSNPLLTNANTTQYFQTVGHADLFQDGLGNWWGVALSTRSGPDYIVYPMGRETVLTAVTWKKNEWPIFSPIRGEASVWTLPPAQRNLRGEGPLSGAPDDIDFRPGSTLPAHFVHWRLPVADSYTVSPPSHPNTLRLRPSNLNLTGHDGNFAGPAGQTFVGRRQTDTLFTFSVNMEFHPKLEEEEAGVSVFLTQNHHIDLGVAMLPNETANDDSFIPHFRFRAISYIAVPDPVVLPVPWDWLDQTLTLEIKAFNLTHYSFSAGPASHQSQMMAIAYGPAADVSFAFTGTLLGVFATSNGRGDQATPAYFSRWQYVGQGQFEN